MKTCTKCKVEQPATSFTKQKDTSDGLRSNCKSCTSVTHAKYSRNNKATIAAKKAEYRNNNKDAIAAYMAEYRAEPANNLRCRAASAFNLGLRKAAKYNDGVKPVISAEEKELMIQFLIAARELSELTGIKFEVDHIIPISKGGEHRLANLQCILKTDNLTKKDKLNFTDYTQKPSYPRAEDIAACQQTTPNEVAA